MSFTEPDSPTLSFTATIGHSKPNSFTSTTDSGSTTTDSSRRTTPDLPAPKVKFSERARLAKAALAKQKNILVVGDGGDSVHSWAKYLSASPQFNFTYCFPGNGGTGTGGHGSGIVNHLGHVRMIDVTEEMVLDAAKGLPNIVVVIVLDTRLIVKGVRDRCHAVGIACFAPSGDAAALEGSPRFAIELMNSFGIPHVDTWVFDKNTTAEYMDSFIAVFCRDDMKYDGTWRCVLKSNNVAANDTGVFKAGADLGRMREDIQNMSYMGFETTARISRVKEGEHRITAMALTDGHSYKLLPLAQNEEWIREPLGRSSFGIVARRGAGCIAPVESVDTEMVAMIKARVFTPVFLAMKKLGKPYHGLLTADILITSKGPEVTNFQVVPGPTEITAVLALVDRETDLATALQSCAGTGNLRDNTCLFTKGIYSCLMMLKTPSHWTRIEIRSFDEERMTAEGTLQYMHMQTKLLHGTDLVAAGENAIAILATDFSLRQAQRLADRAARDENFVQLKDPWVHVKDVSHYPEVGRREIQSHMEAWIERQLAPSSCSATANVSNPDELVEI